MCPEKRDKNVSLVISSTKIGQLCWNLVPSLLNKSAAKSCKRFPPHMSDASTLPSIPCDTWNAYCTSAATELWEKLTPEFFPPELWLPNLPDLNPADYSLWDIVQDKVYLNPHHWSGQSKYKRATENEVGQARPNARHVGPFYGASVYSCSL